MTYRSTVIITQEGKWFVARSAELGVTTQGKTIEEATQNLQEAIDLYLEDAPGEKRLLAHGEPIIRSIEIGRG